MSYQTAQGLGMQGPPSNLYSPKVNVTFGCMLLSQLFKRFGVWGDAVSGYNSGKPLSKAPRSTKENYVPSVMKARDRFIELLGSDVNQ